RLRARNWRSVRVGVGRGPRAPGVIRDLGISRAGEDFDAAAARNGTAPADGAPRGDHLRIAGFRFIGAARGALRGSPEQLSRIGGGVVQAAVRIPVEGGYLLGARAGEQRRLQRVAFEAVQLAFVAGADDDRAVRIECHFVRRVVARFPELIPHAVRIDTIDGAAWRAAILVGRAGPART